MPKGGARRNTGGPKPNSGGARPGAGRKLAPTALEWRDFWRGKFNDDATRQWLWNLAKTQAEEGDSGLLCRLIDKTFPTPNEHSINVGGLPADGVFTVKFGSEGVPIGAAGHVPVPAGDRGADGT